MGLPNDDMSAFGSLDPTGLFENIQAVAVGHKGECQNAHLPFRNVEYSRAYIQHTQPDRKISLSENGSHIWGRGMIERTPTLRDYRCYSTSTKIRVRERSSSQKLTLAWHAWEILLRWYNDRRLAMALEQRLAFPLSSCSSPSARLVYYEDMKPRG